MGFTFQWSILMFASVYTATDIKMRRATTQYVVIKSSYLLSTVFTS